MSLAIVAQVDRNGFNVVDSQTLLVRISCGGLITLNFHSPEEMMVAAEAMAFTAAVVTPVVLVPETPKNDSEVIAIEDTPPPTPREQNNSVKSCDLDKSEDGSRDLLASSDEEEDVGDEGEDQFDEDILAEGVRRVKVCTESDDSFEDTIGLSQEFLW
jgi:hypothetical protein